MGTDKFLELCNQAIIDFYKENTEHSIERKDIYEVWNCKTLQNNKALLSTNVRDGMYFECTYNGDKQELYFDAYEKKLNQCIKVK